MPGYYKLPRASALQLLSALSVLLLTVDTRAMTASPSPSSDGSYVVSWSTALGCTVEDIYPYYPEHCYSLQENGVDIAVSGTSLPITGKPEGSYEYQVYYRMSVYGSPYDEYLVEGPASVIVGTAPPRDPLLTQLDYQFQTRQGDINYDGRTDLFVQRSAGGVWGNGVLYETILTQDATGGTFSAAAPNSYQSSIASGWPLSSATAIVSDFNVDGYVDVQVKGVAAATGISTHDQIVFSPAVPLQSQPLGLRAVDASLKQFVGNSLDYFANPNYFVDNATLEYFSGTFPYYYCSYSYGYSGIIDHPYEGGWVCTTYFIYVSGYYWDYSEFDGRAVVIWSNERGVEAGSYSASQSVESAQYAAEGVLGVGIGGWPMEEIFGTDGEHMDPDIRRGLETAWAIFGIARANAQEVETEEAPSQTARSFNTIYVTGHRVAGFLPTHLALSFVSGSVPLTTISAAGMYSNGFNRLVSNLNRPTEIFNFTLGIVDPCCGQDPGLLFAAMLNADGNYDDDLLYHVSGLHPYYNSNGYVHGLVNAVSGYTSVDFNRFVCGSHPVPASEF